MYAHILLSFSCYLESFCFIWIGEEFFKIKKPSFNEVTFRIQKKESLMPAQAEVEENKSKYFFQLNILWNTYMKIYYKIGKWEMMYKYCC